MSFVTLSDITKQYRMGDIIINANDKVSFDIEKGEFAIIVGPSGSGKTTVLNIPVSYTHLTLPTILLV